MESIDLSHVFNYMRDHIDPTIDFQIIDPVTINRSLENFNRDTLLALTRMPKYIPSIFSEYLLTNERDIEKVVREDKVFYCSLCSTLEPDNMIRNRMTLTGDLVVNHKNLAAIHNHTIHIDNRNYLVIPNTPQYFSTHMLLFTEKHVPSYFLMIDYTYFNDLLTIIDANESLFITFNGNYGSDMYHAHVHLTLDPPPIKNYISNFLVANRLLNNNLVIIPIDSQGVTSLAIGSQDRKELFSNIIPYFMGYLHTDFDSNNTFLSSNLFKIENFYFCNIVVGQKSRAMLKLSNSSSINIIFPSQTINIRNCPDFFRYKDEIVSHIKQTFINPKSIRNNKFTKLNFNDINPKLNLYMEWYIKNLPFEQVPCEVFSWLYNVDKTRLMELYKRNFNSMMCYGDCSPNKFASFKFLFSKYVKRYIDKGATIKDLYSSNTFIQQAIYGADNNIHNII